MSPRLEIVSVCANRWNQNCHILLSPGNSACVVIDPGYGEADIVGAIRSRDLRIAAILATHGHFDHVASTTRLQELFDNPPFLIHSADAATLGAANAFCFSFNEKHFPAPRPDSYLMDGAALDFQGIEINVLHTPGHTPGGCVFSAQETVFTGDLLIKPQKSLEKLPGYDKEALTESRKMVFDRFPSETVSYFGHGPNKSLEQARKFLESQGGL